MLEVAVCSIPDPLKKVSEAQSRHGIMARLPRYKVAVKSSATLEPLLTNFTCLAL